MYKKMIALLLSVCLLVLAGCSQVGDVVDKIADSGEFPVEVAGVTVSARPQQAAVLSPNLADVVLALGYETQLGAVSSDCDQGALSSLTKVNASDVQAVAALEPDLVLLEDSQSQFAAGLQEAGLTVLQVAPATDRADFERLYSQIATAFGGNSGTEHGVAAAQSIFTTLDDINRIVPKDRVTTVCYLYDLDSAAVTGDQFASTVMSYAGVTNIFSSLTGGAYDFESLRLSNPDVIFCAPGVKAQILADSRFENFHAVASGRIFELETSLVQRQGRTAVSLAYEISAAVFPELLEENASSAPDPIDNITSQVDAQTSGASSAVTYTQLNPGDNNDEVQTMQARLEALGYLEGEYDGYYGTYTQDCVRAFQQANGLTVTGVADSETLALLYSEDALPAAGQQP